MKLKKNLDRKKVAALAQALAKKYNNKDVVIGLIGILGAGKTAFTKDFASSLGVKKIKSPTFVIGSAHPLRHKTFYHYDFYRLTDEKQLLPLGFSEILRSKNRIIIIEWVDKFPKIARRCDLIIKFEIAEKNRRNVTIS